MRAQSSPSLSRGVSLLELLIYIGIFSVIGSLFVGILFHANIGWTRSKVESEVQQNVRFAMEDIARTIRTASRVTAPAVGASGTSLTLVVNGVDVVYSRSGNTLQKQIGTNPVESLTTDLVNATYVNFFVAQNTAVSNAAVQATSTQFALSVEYNTTNNQFIYVQHATSTAQLK